MKEDLKDRKDIANHERANYDKIIFALSKNGGAFWEVIENSALIMHNVIHAKIGLKARLTAYQDYYTKRQAVRIAYHKSQMESISRNLTSAKVETEIVCGDNNLKIFKLKNPIDKEQFLTWRRAEDIRVSRRDTLLEPTIRSPELSRLTRDLGDEIVLAVENMRASLRGTFDKRLVDMLLQVYDILDEKEVNTIKILKALKRFGFLVSVLTDKAAVDEKRALRIGVLLQDLRQEINVENADRRVKGLND
ncbi:hypothetical protein AGMMS49975_14360 [Clostridia bacterium]|nr:hypothetical protein AGMMS49975_14360 [Clostridia bacterium]